MRRKTSFDHTPSVLAFVAAILATAASIVDFIIIADVKTHVRQATGTIRNMKAHTGAVVSVEFPTCQDRAVLIRLLGLVECHSHGCLMGQSHHVALPSKRVGSCILLSHFGVLKHIRFLVEKHMIEVQWKVITSLMRQ